MAGLRLLRHRLESKVLRRVNLVEPENRIWLTGLTPHMAPRQHAPVALDATAAPKVGEFMTCSGGAFTGQAAVLWKITDEGGQVVAKIYGLSARYKLQDRDVGHRLACRAHAVNASGVALSQRLELAAEVLPADPPAVEAKPAQPAAAATAGPVTVRVPTAVASPARRLVEPTAIVTTDKALVRRGKPVRVTLTLTGLPASTTQIYVTASKLNKGPKTVTYTPPPGSSSYTARLRLPTNKTTKLGRHRLKLRIVYGPNDAHVTRTVEVRVKP